MLQSTKIVTVCRRSEVAADDAGERLQNAANGKTSFTLECYESILLMVKKSRRVIWLPYEQYDENIAQRDLPAVSVF